ncbi:MAG: nicotinate-nucleotide diphosphorylase (carboxylating) [Nitrospinae bacterium RIFCSPHIGHO2_12_FULL_39_42]|nr:MAG: nicotinate-nucleotide diphosphorylase (carboxylating) [Nitrospinae bacterium RIFCSPHIGHO2_02_39_11]OGV97977.1 MAG: nicotinate-nucleotide diphosphorylase (carboxylating) [Nitrospinae bacterium RIFCSPHIGHO2_12_FULL_39_42]
MNIIYPSIDNLINLALAEDVGSGDITTDAIVSQNVKGEAYVMAKEDMVLSGIDVFKRVFQLLIQNYELGIMNKFKERFKDGEIVRSGKIIIEISGNMRALLTGERTALNFLQRMSGIATLTQKFVNTVRKSKAKIIDTRKTTPNLRILEKYAVRCGGGINHRFGLYDGILIKDNHIKVAGGIIKAVKKVKDNAPHLMKIEVEVKSIKEVRDALKCKADVIMLDNMDISTIKRAVRLINKVALVEVSGGVNLKNVVEITATGVDYISIGALTHSARAVDISMEIR